MILKSVTIFLSAGRRASQMKASQSDKTGRKKKTKTLSKMDLQMGKLDPKTLEMLKRKTHFNKHELETLSRIYRKLVSNCPVTSRQKTMKPGSMNSKQNPTIEGIDRTVFRELLHSTFDIVTEETLMERIFCTWDKGFEGLPLRLEGYICGLSVFLKGTPAEKTAFCFRVYDLNGDGFITRDEMFLLLRNCLIRNQNDEDPDEGVKDLVEIALRKFDIDKDGKVSFHDFSSAVRTENLLLEAFGQVLPTDGATDSFLSTLK
ncbi:unnamed protein product [Diamesa serratosioi]